MAAAALALAVTAAGVALTGMTLYGVVVVPIKLAVIDPLRNRRNRQRQLAVDRHREMISLCVVKNGSGS